jgi:hypothetical protein
MGRQKTVRTIATYFVAVAFSIATGPSWTAGQDKPTGSIDLSKLADDYFSPLVAVVLACYIPFVFYWNLRV